MKKNIIPKSMSQIEIDEFFMREAINEANKSLTTLDWPIGCVITIDNQIVGRGHNRVYSQSNKIHHAEIEAMNNAHEILATQGERATLYVTFEPCPMCTGALLFNHIGRIVYGPNLDRSGGLHLLSSKPDRFQNEKYNIKLVSGVLENECREIFMKGTPTKKIINLIGQHTP